MPLFIPKNEQREQIESLHKCRSPGEVADWLSQQLGGKTVSKAVTTESAYVWVGHYEVRISSHSKYGSNQPMHVRFSGPTYKLLSKLRRAAIAAKNGGLRSYKQVSDLISKRAEENWKSGKTEYRDTIVAEQELAEF